jgi:hypothetical protein
MPYIYATEQFADVGAPWSFGTGGSTDAIEWCESAMAHLRLALFDTTRRGTKLCDYQCGGAIGSAAGIARGKPELTSPGNQTPPAKL